MQNDRRLVCFLVQLTYHGLQVIFQHLHITKASAMPSGEGGAAPKPEAPSPMQVRLCAPAVCIAVIMKQADCNLARAHRRLLGKLPTEF